VLSSAYAMDHMLRLAARWFRKYVGERWALPHASTIVPKL